jgi:hypothetical protein
MTQDADLRQELTADYRVFELNGDHYALGYQMGQATEMRQVESWREPATELPFARACAEVVGRFHPALLDEARGYAAAQGRAWEEVLPHFSYNLPEGTLGGCTTFACCLPDGHRLVARNHDFLYTRKQRYLRRLSPVGYPATLGTQSALIGSCYDGVSSHGLFVAVHSVRAQTAEQVPPGVPSYLVPRILLEMCRTAREAVSQVEAMPHLSPFNYLIADPDDMFAVEAYPGRVRVRRPAGVGLDGSEAAPRGSPHPRLRSGGRPGVARDSDRAKPDPLSLVVTNYYMLPDMRPLQGRRDMSEHIQRARWIEERIAGDRVGDADAGWAWAQCLLRDHSVPVCHHRPNQATFWSLVVDLTARRVAYCLGAPCRNEFHEWDWPEDGAVEV